MRSSRQCARPSLHRVLRPRLSWSAKARWNCISILRLRRFTCASATSRVRTPQRRVTGRPAGSTDRLRETGGMAALAERRVIPHDELKSRSKRKADAKAEAEAEAESQGEETVTPAVRPEDLRLLEALLFASATPL